MPAIASLRALATSLNLVKRPEVKPKTTPGMANIKAIRTVRPFIRGAAEAMAEPVSGSHSTPVSTPTTIRAMYSRKETSAAFRALPSRGLGSSFSAS